MTGPGSAFSGTVYAYADASDTLSTFSLDKTFPTGANVYGIKFQYHMYGAGMGEAKLESSARASSSLAGASVAIFVASSQPALFVYKSVD